MIDLHCHILPGMDDGARDLETALAMARAFVADGVCVVACTPHILPGLYKNTGDQIRAAVVDFQGELDQRDIGLQLVPGADVHIVPALVEGLRSGELLALADSRYVLVEPPRHVAPPRFEQVLFDVVSAGYVPIITHPERLTWLQTQYDLVGRLVAGGVWMQLTAGSLAGGFGRSARELAERMLEEKLAHVLATDAHDDGRRRPDLKRGYELAAARIGRDAAWDLVFSRPRSVLENVVPEY